MRRTAEAPTLIASAQRALRLLEAAAQHPAGATAKQLARDTELALGTTYHLLRTLVHDRYLERRDGRYRTGPAVSGLSTEGRMDGPEAGRVRLDRVLGRIAHELNASVHFARYKDGEVELVAARAAPGAATADPARFAAGAHAHASGKTLLALMSAEERRAHLERHPMVPFTPYTLREPAQLPLLFGPGPQRAAPITQYQEYQLGLVGAAVPIVLGSDLAAIGVGLPSSQAHRLLAVACELRARIGEDLVTAAFGV
ncbi:helix-turn-helix domain-containing protein [Kitasatospora sp. NPDC004531]